MSGKSRKKAKKKEREEFYENPEVLAEKISKTEEFLVANKLWAMWIGGLIAVAITTIFVYRYYQDNQNKLGQSDMFQAVFYFEQDNLDLALNGDGNNYGFIDIIDEYPGTDASNLSNFYVGVINIEKGNFRVAIIYLKDFSSSDLLVQSRAYSLIGDAYMEVEDYIDAAIYYDKAAHHNSNKFFSPVYLKKMATAYEASNELEKAKGCYDEIIEKYKESTGIDEAKKEKARLESLIGS